MNRSTLLEQLATRILALPHSHPLRIGIDGMDAAGKTILADELSTAMKEITNRQVIRASIDRFHNPREIRYRQGENSPEGYYADSFDLVALRQNLLEPLEPQGSRAIQTALFDYRSDTTASGEAIQVPEDAILLFDGIFLHRPELSKCWDFTIFVQVTYETVLTRAVQRDGPRMGGWQGVLDHYMTRYLPAQRRYLETCRPAEHADIVVVNDDPQNPELK